MTLEERIQIYERAFSSDGGDAVLGRAHIAYIIEAITNEQTAVESDGVDSGTSLRVLKASESRQLAREHLKKF